MTALIGKTFDTGILLVADTRITNRGLATFKDDEKKIIVLNKRLVFAYAGVKNIIDRGLEELRKSATTGSTEEIMGEAKRLFSAALASFKKSYPGQSYATVIVFAGFKENDQTFACYFSSDDNFTKHSPLQVFFKTFPNKEMPLLRDFLTYQIDYSKQDIDYFVQKFTLAIRRLKNRYVSKNAYAVYLSQAEILEIKISGQGKYIIHRLAIND